MHPAHVPLEPEAETALVDRPRDAGPRRGLLRRHQHARLAGVGDRVQLLQELDRVEVLVAAVHVRHPLALLARVVQVEHRRDRVHAQPVGVVFPQPVQGAREQEVAHLVAAEVEDECAPVGMLAAARILVLVQGRAVEAGQRPVVLREVRRHPVEDHADPGLVHPVDEGAEVVGRAEPRGRGEIAGHLVAPRRRIGMLHHRQQLDMREAEARTTYSASSSPSSAYVSGRLPSSGFRRQEPRCTS